MNDRVLFIIWQNQVRFVPQGQDHRECFLSLGGSAENYEALVKGFVEQNKIVFFKGSLFQYDAEVMDAAKVYTPLIRVQMNQPSLEVYCGLRLYDGGTKWEPIVKINENEITGVVKKEEKKDYSQVETSPILEVKNNYEDENVRKNMILVTSIVLGIVLITKIVLFQQGKILQLTQFGDMILSLLQVVFLIVTIIGVMQKKSIAKYMGFAASVCIIMTLDIVDVIVGILYFLFCIDQKSFSKVVQFVKNLFTKGKSS